MALRAIALHALPLLWTVSQSSPSEEPIVEEATCVADAIAVVQAKRVLNEVLWEQEEELDMESMAEVKGPPGITYFKETHMSVPSEFNHSRVGLLAMLQGGHVPATPPYACEAHPHMCEPPFNCQNWSLQDTIEVMLHGLATEDGHVNPRSWCMPGLEGYADTLLKECITGRNPKAGADVLLSSSASQGLQELDASYCFAEGHCSNEQVSDESTIEHAEKICDERFGHESWTSNFMQSVSRAFALKNSKATALMTLNGGFTTSLMTRALSLAACAQGTFHCEVQYCKHTHCKDSWQASKYGSLAPSKASMELVASEEPAT